MKNELQNGRFFLYTNTPEGWDLIRKLTYQTSFLLKLDTPGFNPGNYCTPPAPHSFNSEQNVVQ